MRQVHEAGDAGVLVELAQIVREIRVARDRALVAPEQRVIHEIEAQQARQQPPVGFGDLRAGEIACVAEMFFEPVERTEQQVDRLFVSRLVAREAHAVHAVVDAVVHALIDGVDRRAQRVGVVVLMPIGERLEGAVQHADDLGRLVVDDGSRLPIPQHRHGHIAAVVRLRRGVHTVQVREAFAVRRAAAGEVPELPALAAVVRHRNGHRDHVLEAFEPAVQHGSPGPWAVVGHI